MDPYDDWLAQVKSAYNDGTEVGHGRVAAIAAEAWGAYQQSRPDDRGDLASLGEVFRRAAIVSVAVGAPDARAWRTRSMAMFTLAGSPNGIAMLVLPAALAELTAGDHTTALGLLALMHDLGVESDPVVPIALARSAAFENAGIIRLAAGDLDLARSDFEQAYEIESIAGDQRRMLKLRASLTSVDYLGGMPEQATADLEAVIAECQHLGTAADVLATAEANLVKMQTGENTLTPYQVI